jgi:peptide/nickel transport system permease protein
VLLVAALSYLGLGIPPPAANWGSMLSNGLNFSYSGFWWMIYPPGLAIVITVVAFNMVGDGLRDAFGLARRR